MRFGITIPLCFSLVGGFLFILQMSKDAEDVLIYVGEIGAGVFVLVAMMLINSLMTKCVPQQGKGTLLGLMIWVGSLGLLVCSEIGGVLFDVDKDLPFVVIACLCWAYAVFIGGLSLCGVFAQ